MSSHVLTACRGSASSALLTIPIIIVSRHHWVPLYRESWGSLMTQLPINMMTSIRQVLLAVPFSRNLWLGSPCFEILAHILLGQTSHRFWEWRLQEQEGTDQSSEFRQREHLLWAKRHETVWMSGKISCRNWSLQHGHFLPPSHFKYLLQGFRCVCKRCCEWI